MVGVTGCGCPVDTSVHGTEAPTEAAAENGCPVDTSVHSTEALTEAETETLNPWLPLAVPKIAFRLVEPSNFDRCAIEHSLYRLQDAIMLNAWSLRFGTNRPIKKHPPLSEYFLFIWSE